MLNILFTWCQFSTWQTCQCLQTHTKSSTRGSLKNWRGAIYSVVVCIRLHVHFCLYWGFSPTMVIAQFNNRMDGKTTSSHARLHDECSQQSDTGCLLSKWPQVNNPNTCCEQLKEFSEPRPKGVSERRPAQKWDHFEAVREGVLQ